SMVSYERGIRNGLPSYISVPNVTRSGGPSFLGGQHAPFVIDGNPNSKSFRVRDVTLPAEIDEAHAKTGSNCARRWTKWIATRTNWQKIRRSPLMNFSRR